MGLYDVRIQSLITAFAKKCNLVIPFFIPTGGKNIVSETRTVYEVEG